MNREDNLKEKFKQALISTAKVISDDIFVEKKNEKNIQNNFDIIKIEDLNNKNDFIRSRADMDSAALKKNFQIIPFTKKIYLKILFTNRFIKYLKK